MKMYTVEQNRTEYF